jgi:hypothetical protein
MEKKIDGEHGDNDAQQDDPDPQRYVHGTPCVRAAGAANGTRSLPTDNVGLVTGLFSRVDDHEIAGYSPCGY